MKSVRTSLLRSRDEVENPMTRIAWTWRLELGWHWLGKISDAFHFSMNIEQFIDWLAPFRV